MKETTVNSLIVARTLFEQAAGLCASDDRHLASAGLVILQDVLELAFYALLIELGVDEAKNLESKSFDELVGELKKAGVPVPKSGTLKALNKQRVLTKHYAQLAEPATVRGYFDVAAEALASVVATVTGEPLSEIYMADLLGADETREFLKRAETLIASGEYFEALTAIRKAIFIEFEADYSVYGWRDYEGGEGPLGLGSFSRGGWKAPFWTQRKDWIQKYVRDPLDYIQIDYDHWRLDATEWGINTAELQSIRNLTPSVFRPDEHTDWSIKYDAALPTRGATHANAKYCLDRATRWCPA
jgi:flagellar biosynthesis regulator FlbT